MREDDLIHCPFCHSQKVKLGSKRTGNNSKGRVRVTVSMRCGACHARGPAVSKENPSAHDLEVMRMHVRTLWNTR